MSFTYRSSSRCERISVQYTAAEFGLPFTTKVVEYARRFQNDARPIEFPQPALRICSSRRASCECIPSDRSIFDGYVAVVSFTFCFSDAVRRKALNAKNGVTPCLLTQGRLFYPSPSQRCCALSALLRTHRRRRFAESLIPLSRTPTSTHR